MAPQVEPMTFGPYLFFYKNDICMYLGHTIVKLAVGNQYISWEEKKCKQVKDKIYGLSLSPNLFAFCAAF